MKRRRIIGITSGTVAAVSYGTNPLFALPLYAAGIGVNSVLFYRYFIAVIIYGLWLRFHRKISLKIPVNTVFPLFILGLLFSLSSYTLFDAFKYIDAGIACTILFIYPALVAVIMTLFFREKISKTVISSVILISAGVFLLYNGKPDAVLNTYGVVVVFASALLYALYIVGVKNIKSLQHLNSGKITFYVMLFGLLVYIYNLRFCTELQILDKPVLWLFTLALALLPTIISIEAVTIAIKLIGSTSAAILGSLEPLTAIFFGVVIFHEQLTFRIIAGILAVLSGVMLIITRKRDT